MYNYSNLVHTVVASGERYAARVHRQTMPFMVLRRLAVEDNMNSTFKSASISAARAVEYTLRGLRDTLTARKEDKPKLMRIWDSGFLALTEILRIYGVEIVEGCHFAATLYKTLKSIGYDVLTESFYRATNTKYQVVHMTARMFSHALAYPAMYTSANICQRTIARMQRLHTRYGIDIEMSNFSDKQRVDVVDLTKTIIDCAEVSGYYYTFRYFAAFAPRFKLSDKLVKSITDCLDHENYNKNVLLQVYWELEKLNAQGELPRQRGIACLFDFCGRPYFNAGYTNVFGR